LYVHKSFFFTFSISKGLAKCAFIPESKHLCTSSAKALAVIAIIGIIPASGQFNARIALVAVNPSITGIIISISIASNVPTGLLLNNSTAYPEKAFGKPKALRAFLCMDVSLSTNEILDNYVCRWPIEVFFRQCKDKLALDSYQIRSAQGIRRYWLIMSFAHYMCVVGTGKVCPFETGYRKISDIIQMEKYLTLYQYARECIGFDSFVKVVA
jgi:hypothetical protein